MVCAKERNPQHKQTKVSANQSSSKTCINNSNNSTEIRKMSEISKTFKEAFNFSNIRQGYRFWHCLFSIVICMLILTLVTYAKELESLTKLLVPCAKSLVPCAVLSRYCHIESFVLVGNSRTDPPVCGYKKGALATGINNTCLTTDALSFRELPA